MPAGVGLQFSTGNKFSSTLGVSNFETVSPSAATMLQVSVVSILREQ